MDAQRFDRLTRALSERGSRRGLLGLLATLPILGGLVALCGSEESEAKGRRKRRKKPHHHRKKTGNRAGNTKQRRCDPESKTKTCSGKCGSVQNNCRKTVDCGSCDCPEPCAECFTCQGEAGKPARCVPRDAGTPCGDDATCENGTVTPQGRCDGSGQCDPGDPFSCDPYRHCDGSACAQTCADDDDCVNGSFCDQDQHCVGDGDNGDPCTHGGQCQSGFCVDDVCCDSACDGACFACDVAGSVGECVVDPDQQGEPCGGHGQVCQPDGACACSGNSCGACRTCEADGTCAGCSGCCDGETCVSDCGDCQICDNGQCTGCPDCCDAEGVCQDGESDAACGSSGACEVCTGQEECQQQQCVCVPDCEDKICGSDGCSSTCQPGCGPNSTCTDGGMLCECDFVSCDDACCADGESCCDSDCVDLQSDPDHCGDCETACGNGQTCQAGVCGVICGNDFCPAATETCVDGACLPCNVACTGTPAQCGAALQSALDVGGTVRVCAGTYRGGFTITKTVTLSGVGEGDDPLSSTILDGNNAARVLLINSGVASVTLRNLRISGGTATDDGAGIKHQGTKLEMRDCTVAGNTLTGGTGGGGLSVGSSGTLEMTRCTVSDNNVDVGQNSGRGGGGLATGGATTLTDCIIERNNSGDVGGGINVFGGLTKLTGTTEVRRNIAIRGGGCFVTGGGAMDIEETCRVTRNMAHSEVGGGGINETQFGTVVLQGADPSPIVVANCIENCVGTVPKCAAGGSCS